jgi:hypothetical protein
MKINLIFLFYLIFKINFLHLLYYINKHLYEKFFFFFFNYCIFYRYLFYYIFFLLLLGKCFPEKKNIKNYNKLLKKLYKNLIKRRFLKLI